MDAFSGLRCYPHVLMHMIASLTACLPPALYGYRTRVLQASG